MDRLPSGVALVRADNPSPLTLEGTNTYVVERWVVDPGPADDAHIAAVERAASAGIEGIALTHGHPDHAEGAADLARRAGVAVSRPCGGERVGPFEAIATPGHSPDHVALLRRRVLFSGDAVLGRGSVFIAPGGGSLADYLDSLERLSQLELDAICPGHGPVVWDPKRKIGAYIAHRRMRERRVLEALAAGARSESELLERAWSDVDLDAAPFIRVAAALTLKAHLQKLDADGRLPADLPRSLLET